MKSLAVKSKSKIVSTSKIDTKLMFFFLILLMFCRNDLKGKKEDYRTVIRAILSTQVNLNSSKYSIG